MSGPSKDVARYLEDDAVAAAIDEAQRAENPYLVRRLCFVRNLYRGDSISEAADRVGVSQPTGSRWADAWNADGVAGLEPAFGGGRPPKLSDEERERVESLLERRGPLAAGDVQQLLEAAFGVTYSTRHVARVFGNVEGERMTTDREGSPETDDLEAMLDDIVQGR